MIFKMNYYFYDRETKTLNINLYNLHDEDLEYVDEIIFYLLNGNKVKIPLNIKNDRKEI